MLKKKSTYNVRSVKKIFISWNFWMLLLNDCQNNIFEIISNNPFCSAKFILEQLANQDKKVSRAWLYVVLEKLLTKRIIKKDKKKLFIHPAYISKVRDFMIKSKSVIDFAENEVYEGMIKRIKLSSFIETNVVRPYYINIIEQKVSLDEYYSAQYHDPYLLSENEFLEEQPNLYEMDLKKKIYYNLFCGDTALDRYHEENKLIEKRFPGSVQKLIPKNILIKNQYSIQLLGDYVIEIHCSEEFMREMDTYFDSHTISNHQPEIIRSIFAKQTPCLMIIEHNPTKASFRKKKIMKYF